MKKVYVLVAAAAAAFGALSIGSASFASSGSVPTDETVPATDDTVPVTDSPTTTTIAPTTIAPTTIESTTSTTTTVLQAGGVTVSSDASVGQEAPTTTIRRVGSDGLLPNTGADIAIPLVLAGLAAGTGAATLLVRRRSNAS